MHRVPAQGQLRGLRPLPERQEPSDLQDEAVREAHREEGKWRVYPHFCLPDFDNIHGAAPFFRESFSSNARNKCMENGVRWELNRIIF